MSYTKLNFLFVCLFSLLVLLVYDFLFWLTEHLIFIPTESFHLSRKTLALFSFIQQACVESLLYVLIDSSPIDDCKITNAYGMYNDSNKTD